MPIYIFLVSMIFSAAIRQPGSGFFSKQIPDVAITIIYDNYTDYEDLQGDWGFSCLIEGKEKTILFDTGAKPEIFLSNIERLKIDLQSIDLAVISHNHGDHIGGLPALMDKGVIIPVYIPAAVQNDINQYLPGLETITIGVKSPVELCDGVFLTGEMGHQINEQSLIVETPRGWILITGCSHPGIQHILDQAVEISKGPVFLVMGGFHMLDHDPPDIEEVIDRFKFHKVIHCAPTHCTGNEAIFLFQEAYGEKFLRMGSGKKITISAEGIL